MTNDEIAAELDKISAAQVTMLATLKNKILTPPPSAVTPYKWDAKSATQDSRLNLKFAGVASVGAFCSFTVALADGTATQVPPGTKAGCSDDHHLSIRRESWMMTYDEWRAIVSPTGEVTCMGRGDVPDGAVSETRPGNSNAARLPLRAGLITPDDVSRGLIDHALVFCFPVGQYVPPAAPSLYPADTDFNGTVMKYGQWFRLDPTLDLNSLALDPLSRMIGVALQNYGAFCRDYGDSLSFFGVDAINQGGNAEAYKRLNLNLAINGYPYATRVNLPWNRIQGLLPPPRG